MQAATKQRQGVRYRSAARSGQDRRRASDVPLDFSSRMGAAPRELGLLSTAPGTAIQDEFPASASLRLERRVRAHLPSGDVTVTLTDNRYTMISVQRGGAHYKVRLHHMFVEAGSTVIRALARYIVGNDSDASRTLGEYIDGHQFRVRRDRNEVRGLVVTTSGSFFDLQEVFDDLNRRYFQGAIKATITWGQRCGRPRRRNSIKMGSYSVEERVIRIHRSLDRAFVPRFFLEWIVFHEMLHQMHEVRVVKGRRRFHTPAFLADEARYEHYDLARTWEREHIDELLTY